MSTTKVSANLIDISGATTDSSPDIGADYVLTYDASASAAKKALLSSLVPAYVYVREEQASGTQGGTFTSGAWQTRVLNTEVSDTAGIASLSSNRVTLAAGTYRFFARAPVGAVESNRLRLYNITDSSVVATGSTGYCGGYSGTLDSYQDAMVRGIFTIASAKAFELQHYCKVTRATDGFGVAGGASAGSVVEVYAEIEFWKVG